MCVGYVDSNDPSSHTKATKGNTVSSRDLGASNPDIQSMPLETTGTQSKKEIKKMDLLNVPIVEGGSEASLCQSIRAKSTIELK